MSGSKATGGGGGGGMGDYALPKGGMGGSGGSGIVLIAYPA